MRIKPDALEAALQGASQIVVDASVAIDAAIGENERRALALRFLGLCDRQSIRLVAPPLFAAEVDTGIRQVMIRQGLDPAGALQAFRVLDALPVHLIWDATQMHSTRLRARAIASELAQPSVYDTTYAALAQMRGCYFWTSDKTFANAARSPIKGKPGQVRLDVVRFIGDYAKS